MSFSEEEIQRKLSYLNEDELFILEKVYAGLTQPEIKKKHGYSVSYTKKIMDFLLDIIRA